MLIAKEHRDQLALYCQVKKVTQEVAVNEMVGEALSRIDQTDPLLKEKMTRVAAIRAELAAI